MKTVVTGAEMKAIDTYTIQELGIPSLVLMERAALSMVCRMKEKIHKVKELENVKENEKQKQERSISN